MQPRYRRIGSRIAVALAALVALVSVYQLYLGGNLALAAACTAGFGLAFYVFNAMFKKKFGVTPSEWRRQNVPPDEMKLRKAALKNSR